ncbi:KTSC domain-containing protein [Afipia sp. GAS231]|uniref:KTSC domain-containing protein n=1 Tax=Afipia sp. GAS231 TaxID=1882747 RepID=UPI00087DBB4C|nr:KTSC domain-containing protein [Afipia sp. GAS231]SDM94974.1 KTSC domain-containing protein [Afipia sp. GAS231]
MIRTATSFILFLLTAPVGTETVDLRNSKPIDLGTFECRDINRSTMIQRVCYDRAQRAMIVGIKSGYDRFCELPPETFDGFMTAPSMGQFYNQNIRGLAPDGRYECPTTRAPNS